MLSPYGLDIVESCLTCKMRTGRIFCDLSTAALQTFERIKYAAAYPKGAILFLQGQAPRGIFVLCQGQVKLSLGDRYGKTLILKIVEPGEVLGLSATVSGTPYELTAQTICPCQVTFVKRKDLLQFLKENSDACFKVAEQLSDKYNNACHEIRSLGLSHSAVEKLAKLLLEWSYRKGESKKVEPSLRLGLTQDEIAQMIGVSRETVTRLFAALRKRHIAQWQGSRLLIRDKRALQALAGSPEGAGKFTEMTHLTSRN
ncbi:MAG TPA: Crp/Fnr family transcriptional regulator [Terriglobales bacterium]|nr:Crp/Fnr family transcriptional regulator [Terriglobales bacterium]